jgi:hypothetical protein
MPITIPDKTKLKMTTDFKTEMGQRKPAIAGVAMTNPGPVAVAAVQNASSGQVQVVPAAGDAGRAGYLGYNFDHDVPAGEGASVVRGVYIEGFAGVTPGGDIYIDATSADASGNASGLTHTLPTTGNVRTPIGVGLSATKIAIF